MAVSPADTNEPARVLNYLTAPHVVIWSAVSCSSAFPFLFMPQDLLARDAHGQLIKCALVLEGRQRLAREHAASAAAHVSLQSAQARSCTPRQPAHCWGAQVCQTAPAVSDYKQRSARAAPS